MLYPNATAHVMHIPLEEGGHFPNQQITFSNGPLFPNPQQLAAISWQDSTSPTYQSVHYGAGRVKECDPKCRRLLPCGSLTLKNVVNKLAAFYVMVNPNDTMWDTLVPSCQRSCGQPSFSLKSLVADSNNKLQSIT